MSARISWPSSRGSSLQVRTKKLVMSSLPVRNWRSVRLKPSWPFPSSKVKTFFPLTMRLTCSLLYMSRSISTFSLQPVQARTARKMI